MTVTLGFDVYGTLIDTQGVISSLKNIMGNLAPAFSQTWRDKQLEYTFRRGLMGRYENFSICTGQALDYACHLYSISLTKNQRAALLDCYSTLPTFPEIVESLTYLQGVGFRLFAFSNGTEEGVKTVLKNANIMQFFQGIISCDEIKTFKPNPNVYEHFLQKAQSTKQGTWLISANPFDVIGASSVGMNTAWVKRSETTVYDPWGIEPSVTITDLNELGPHLLTSDKLELYNTA